MRLWTGSASSYTYVRSASVSSAAYGLVTNVICIVALSPPIAVHGFFCFPAGFLGAFVLAAVPLFLALCQGDLAFCQAIAKVDSQGNNGQTFGLGAAGQLVDFILVQQELARTERLVIPGTTRQVLCNVCVYEPSARRFELNESVANIRLSFAQSLHFRAVDDETGLMLLENMVVIVGGTVFRHD